MVTPLTLAIARAETADDAFDAAVKAAGYKSRWDMGSVPQQSQALRDAYFAKVDADKAVHEEFERARCPVDVSNIQEYGLTQKLSNSIRVF